MVQAHSLLVVREELPLPLLNALRERLDVPLLLVVVQPRNDVGDLLLPDEVEALGPEQLADAVYAALDTMFDRFVVADGVSGLLTKLHIRTQGGTYRLREELHLFGPGVSSA
jgi:hypothetical protein